MKKVIYKEGNISPSGKYYSRTLSDYITKWMVYINIHTWFVSEKVVKTNIARRELPEKQIVMRKGEYSKFFF